MKEDNKVVIDKAELRRMSPAERRELASLLAELDDPAPGDRAAAKAAAPVNAVGPANAAGPVSRIRTAPTHSSAISRCAVNGGWRCSSRRLAA